MCRCVFSWGVLCLSMILSRETVLSDFILGISACTGKTATVYMVKSVTPDLRCKPQVHRLTTVKFPWWRHQMETFSASLSLCAGNSPITGEFPAHKGQWRIPRAKASDAELWCFLWSAPEWTFVWTIVRLVIWDATFPSWRHSNADR